jgi:hypothetical protein
MPMTMTERLDHARAALTAYFEAKGEPLPDGPWDFEDTDASDLIADLLHLQKRLGLRDTEKTLQTALLHFEAEEEDEPEAYSGSSLAESKTPPHPVKTITVKIHRGLFEDVTGLPEGYELRVEDYDGDDTSHPAWVAEKACYVTVYQGGSNG